MTEDQKKEALDLYRHGVRVKTIPLFINSTPSKVQRFLYIEAKVQKK